jgi:hypothetical protein
MTNAVAKDPTGQSFEVCRRISFYSGIRDKTGRINDKRRCVVPIWMIKLQVLTDSFHLPDTNMGISTGDRVKFNLPFQS